MKETIQESSEAISFSSGHPLLRHRTNAALYHLYKQGFLEASESWAVGSRHFARVSFRRFHQIVKDWRLLLRDFEIGMAGGVVTILAATASFFVGAIALRPHWSQFAGSFVLSFIARFRTIVRQGIMADVGQWAKKRFPYHIEFFQIRGHHFSLGAASLGKIYAPIEQAFENWLANSFYNTCAGIGLSWSSLIIKSSDQALASIAFTLPIDLFMEDPKKTERLKRWAVRPINKFLTYYSLAGLMAFEKGIPGPPLWGLAHGTQRLCSILGGLLSIITLPKIRPVAKQGTDPIERGLDWDGKPLNVEITLHGQVIPDRKIPSFEDGEEDVASLRSTSLEWINVNEEAESGNLRATNSFLANTSAGARINRGSLDFKTLNNSELTWLCLKNTDCAPWPTINRYTGYNDNPNLVKFYFLYEPTGKIEETALTQPPITFKSPSYGMVHVQGQHRMGEVWRRSQKERRPLYFPTFMIEMTDEEMEKLVVKPFGGIEKIPHFPPPFLNRSRIGVQNPGIATRKRFFVNIREVLNPLLQKEIENARANFLAGNLPFGGTGIACGTLSPTHQGHLSLWLQAVRQLGLKRLVVFTVNRSRTHKGPILSHAARQSILVNKVRDFPEIEVFSPLEGWSITDNIRRIISLTPPPHTLVCGGDTVSLYTEEHQLPPEMKIAVRPRLDCPMPPRSERIIHLLDDPENSSISNRSTIEVVSSL
ncbi:MAG: hypothetical protein HYS22_07680 [Deltaproteobacteria bacterium]|nr:hypothetical protein [Deltaproteobacteria bacterium]